MQPEPVPANPFASSTATNVPVHKIDSDYLFFIQHIRPDGNSYAVEVPGDGVSPPIFLKYENPPAASSGSAGASVPSMGRARRSLQRKDKDKDKEKERDVASSGGEGPGASAPSKGRARKSPRRKEEKEEEKKKDSSADRPFYETLAGIDDEDYLTFLRHIDSANGEIFLRIGGHVVTYPGEMAPSEGSSESEGEEDAGGTALGEDDVGEEDEEEEASWEDDVEEEDEEETSWEDDEDEDQEKEEIINADGSPGYDSCTKVRDCHVPWQKMEVKDEEEEIIPSSGKYGAEKNKGVSSDGTLETPKIVNQETSSSNSHNTEPHIAAELHDVIWPKHIIARPESDFKQRLLHVLDKPFNQGEYVELNGLATKRKMALKIRRLRSVEKEYYSGHENESYYDIYPDLAKQVKGTSYPNGLALLRGFFFWLKNVGHEDGFMPWNDDHMRYKVVPLTEQIYPPGHTRV